MNPTMTVHPVYKMMNSNVPEHSRMHFSRLRLIAHHLKIETGRWSRIPREERLCTCLTDIQTEEHVICYCPLTLFVRDLWPSVVFSFPTFFESAPSTVCEIIRSIVATL